MTLKTILTSLKKAQTKRVGVRPQHHQPSVSRGTAFLDQKRLSPTTIEKHYIGSMLYAFNFAEETQRAEGGQPLKVVRTLTEDLGQGSYVHKPTDEPSPHESVHEMWEKMSYIKAKFTAVYGHEPGIIPNSTSNSSDSSFSVYDESSESDVVFEAIIEKRGLSTIEEMSEFSGSIQALADNDASCWASDVASSLANLSTDLVSSTSHEDLTIPKVTTANTDFEAPLQSSESDPVWLNYSVSSDTKEEMDDDDVSSSSIETSVEVAENTASTERFLKESDKEYFEDLPFTHTSFPKPAEAIIQSTKSFVVLSGRKCTPALGFDIDSMPALHSSISSPGDVPPITREATLAEYGLTGLEFNSSPSIAGSVPSSPVADKKTFIGDVEIVLDIAEAFSKVDSLTGNRDLPDFFLKPRKSKSMSNLIHKVFHHKRRPGSDDESFDLTPASLPSRPLSSSSISKLSRWKINIISDFWPGQHVEWSVKC